MSVEVEDSQTDADMIDMEIDDDEVQPKLNGKEASLHTLEMRRKIEDRLERRRLRDMLGCDDLWELDA